MAGLSRAGAGWIAGETCGRGNGRVTCMIRSATQFTRATWILPVSKDFVREKTDLENQSPFFVASREKREKRRGTVTTFRYKQ